jgi:tetratricopeptide (TPR) repeat protein
MSGILGERLGKRAVARTVIEVFLSSTAADLKPHRDALSARLERLEFIKCVRQEVFGAQDAGAVQFCCEKARASDIFVGLIGFRRGWEPDGDNAQRSITEMEYDSAKDAGRARYLWVSPDDFLAPSNQREPDALHDRQLEFRKRVMGGGERIVSQKGFASAEALASEIVEQLLAHVVTGDLIKLLRPELWQPGIAPLEDQKPAIAAAVEKLAEDKDVDLLAIARNPQGIDIAVLETKLVERAETHAAAGQRENKASAEYWRHAGVLAFLHNTRKSLAAYDKATELDPDNPDGWRYRGELQFRLGDLDDAVQSFGALRTLGKRTDDKRAEAMGCMRLGWIHRTRGELAEAEAVTVEALRLAEGWSEDMARAYGNLGLIHWTRGDLDKAEEMHRKALALNEELGSKEGMARAYANLGLIHWTRGDLGKAEEMHRKALALNEELGSKEGMALAYGNLGIIHKTRGDLGKAEEVQRKALALNEELGSKEGMARAYANLGVIHDTRGDLAKAENMHRKALKLNEELGSKQGMATAYGNLGAIHWTRGDLRKAEEMHRKALALDTELGNKDGIARHLWNLSLIHEQRGEKKQLCDCLRRSRDLRHEMGLLKQVIEAEQRMKQAKCPEL